tara:strand:+ start:2867 stop:3301 length:435 start_codon:yes stop_codon:yes gene_type:complete
MSSSSGLLSLYVPIISEYTSETYIKKMFANKNIGKIARVDFVKNIVKNRREAFIHFEEWFNNKEANNLKEDILNKDTKTRFKYNDSKKFWPLLVNKNPNKKEVNPNYIILDSSEIKNTYKISLNLNKKNDNLLKITNKKEKKTT